MPGHFRLWPPSYTDWHTWSRSHAGNNPIPDKMNIDHLKLLCEFKKYEVVTVSVVGGQSNKQRCLLKRVDFFPFSDKPAFTTHPHNKTVLEGDTVTLFCNATGNPKPSFSWTIDGLPVNITVHSRISFTADNKQLTVENVNKTDSHHKYRCLARNSIGTITSYAASLTVQCESDSKILRVCIIHYLPSFICR